MEKKQQYFDKLIKLISEYPKVLVVECDNVGSHHMQKVRKSLLGEAVMLMGKNVRGEFSIFSRCSRATCPTVALFFDLFQERLFDSRGPICLEMPTSNSSPYHFRP